jgi:hypothetical protein
MTARVIKLILVLILFGCAPEEKKPATHVREVRVLVRSFANEMEKEYRLVCIGSGGGMPQEIEEVEVAFAALRKGTIEEARKLEIEGTEKLLQKINGDEQIRPYLKEYPFQRKQASISISFRHKLDLRYPDSVALVFQANDRIYYCAHDPEKDALIDLLIEPYDEAKRLLFDQGIERGRQAEEPVVSRKERH